MNVSKRFLDFVNCKIFSIEWMFTFFLTLPLQTEVVQQTKFISARVEYM
jgi:hypothetical protein